MAQEPRAPFPSPAHPRRRRLMERGQAQQLAAKNFLCFQPPPSFFFSFPLTISHSLFYIKPRSGLAPSLSCFGFSAPLNFSVLLSCGSGRRQGAGLSHCFPPFRGVGECGWNRETDAFSLLLAKDALNMWSFPQRGLLYIVSLDPRPHRLKPIANSSADSSASAGGCYVWLCRRSSAEWLRTYTDARRWRVGSAACPCSPVEVSFQVTVVLLSALLSLTCLWCGWRGNERGWACGNSGHRDASGPGKLWDCCRATQGGPCHAGEGCAVPRRAAGGLLVVSVLGVLLRSPSWGSWMVLSSGRTCCLVCWVPGRELADQALSPKPYLWLYVCPHGWDTVQVSLENLGKLLLWGQRGRSCGSRISCNFSLPFFYSNLSSAGCCPGCVLCVSVVCLCKASRSHSCRRSHGLMFQERETVSVRGFFFGIFLIPLPQVSRLNHLLSPATLLYGTCLLGKVPD